MGYKAEFKEHRDSLYELYLQNNKVEVRTTFNIQGGYGLQTELSRYEADLKYK